MSLTRAGKDKLAHIRNDEESLCGKLINYQSTKGCEICDKCIDVAGKSK